MIGATNAGLGTQECSTRESGAVDACGTACMIQCLHVAKFYTKEGPGANHISVMLWSEGGAKRGRIRNRLHYEAVCKIRCGAIRLDLPSNAGTHVQKAKSKGNKAQVCSGNQLNPTHLPSFTRLSWPLGPGLLSVAGGRTDPDATDGKLAVLMSIKRSPKGTRHRSAPENN